MGTTGFQEKIITKTRLHTLRYNGITLAVVPGLGSPSDADPGDGEEHQEDTGNTGNDDIEQGNMVIQTDNTAALAQLRYRVLIINM